MRGNSAPLLLLSSIVAALMLAGCVTTPIHLDPLSVEGRDGGGRPDMAQAGGADASRAETALAAVERAIAAKLQAAA